jgi:hypothetical protein
VLKTPMGMLDGQTDFVLGVDTHRDSHSAAVVNPNGGVCGELTVPTDAFGNAKVFAFAEEHAPGRGVWGARGASAPVLLPTCSNTMSGSSRSTDPLEPDAMVPSPTP